MIWCLLPSVFFIENRKQRFRGGVAVELYATNGDLFSGYMSSQYLFLSPVLYSLRLLELLLENVQLALLLLEVDHAPVSVDLRVVFQVSRFSNHRTKRQSARFSRVYGMFIQPPCVAFV